MTTSVVPDTFPATAISHSLDEHGAVLMATHGRSGIGKALLGSVAEDVVKATERPVMLLGPSASGPSSLVGGVLIIPIDGGETAGSILPCATEWAKALGPLGAGRRRQQGRRHHGSAAATCPTWPPP